MASKAVFCTPSKGTMTFGDQKHAHECSCDDGPITKRCHAYLVKRLWWTKGRLFEDDDIGRTTAQTLKNKPHTRY